MPTRAQIADVGNKVGEVLSTAIESWRGGDRDRALSVRARQAPIQAECESLFQKISQLVAVQADGVDYVDLMLICKHLERILRHAVCVAVQAADAGE